MANIRIDLNHAPLDGETVSFKAPCNASEITGLIAYYLDGSGQEVSKEFTLNDANGNDIGMIDGIFAEGAIVKVILDTDMSNAFVQNPDTNAYLEGRFDGKVNKDGDTLTGALSFADPDGGTESCRIKRWSGNVTDINLGALSIRFDLPSFKASGKLADGIYLRNTGTGGIVNFLHTGNYTDYAATTASYTATVATGWTASGSHFYKDVTVSGLLATDNPIVDINPSTDNAANVLYSEAICKVFRITTSANSIRLWATEAIATAFPIQIKVVR